MYFFFGFRKKEFTLIFLFICTPNSDFSGYSCADHFYESDTVLHSWEVLVELLCNRACYGIIVDVGMPVRHKNVLYNCRIILLNG